MASDVVVGGIAPDDYTSNVVDAQAEQPVAAGPLANCASAPPSPVLVAPPLPTVASSSALPPPMHAHG